LKAYFSSFILPRALWTISSVTDIYGVNLRIAYFLKKARNFFSTPRNSNYDNEKILIGGRQE
jgi:hypothetical protein